MSRSSTRGPQRRPRAAAEGALHRLQLGEQLVGRQLALDDRDGIGEAAAGRAQRGRGADRRDARRRRSAASAARNVSAGEPWRLRRFEPERDRIACLRHRAPPRRSRCCPKARSPKPKRRAIARSARASSRSGRSCGPSIPTGGTRRCPLSAIRSAWLAIVGLAPGMWGANRTGRPFTGDHAGHLFYRDPAQIRPGRGRL